jgi:hypothetical protein
VKNNHAASEPTSPMDHISPRFCGAYNEKSLQSVTVHRVRLQRDFGKKNPSFFVLFIAMPKSKEIRNYSHAADIPS